VELLVLARGIFSILSAWSVHSAACGSLSNPTCHCVLTHHDCWRCRCTGWAEVAAAESATRWTDSVWIPKALPSSRLHALAVWLRCCSQHGMTLHVSLICCEQNASKLLFRFSFRPFFWVSLMSECFSSSIIFWNKFFAFRKILYFLIYHSLVLGVIFAFRLIFWLHQRNHNIFWGVFSSQSFRSFFYDVPV